MKEPIDSLNAPLAARVTPYRWGLAGVGVLEGTRAVAGDGDFFKNPGVDIKVALVAFAVLIVSGLLAGLLPARRALAIKAVGALRAE